MKLSLKKQNLTNLSKDLNELHSEQTQQINGGVQLVQETLKGCDHVTTHTYTVAWGNCQVEM